MWYTLPLCLVTNFGLAAVDEKPVLFGGKVIAQGAQITDDCFTFLADSNEWQILDKSFPPNNKPLLQPVIVDNACFSTHSNQVMHKLELPVVIYDTVNVVHKFQTLIQDGSFNFIFGGSMLRIDESLFCISTSGSNPLPVTYGRSYQRDNSLSRVWSSTAPSPSHLSLMFYSSLKEGWITLAKNFISQVILSSLCYII